jgi:hypothetical protein
VNHSRGARGGVRMIPLAGILLPPKPLEEGAKGVPRSGEARLHHLRSGLPVALVLTARAARDVGPRPFLVGFWPVGLLHNGPRMSSAYL